MAQDPVIVSETVFSTPLHRNDHLPTYDEPFTIVTAHRL